MFINLRPLINNGDVYQTDAVFTMIYFHYFHKHKLGSYGDMGERHGM